MINRQFMGKKTYGVIMCGARLEPPFWRREERADVVFDEQLLVFFGVQIFEGTLRGRCAALERVQVAIVQTLRDDDNLGELRQKLGL